MKQILITGASTGIGYSLAKALCEKGHRVWAGVRKPEVLQRLSEDYPQLLTVLKLDVINSSDIEKAFQVVSANFDENKEFILVNNAGVAVAGPVESLAVDEWRKLYDVNLFGPVKLTQIFLPLIRKTKGRVVNVGSISGLISSPFLAPYCSSKFALRSFSDSLRREVGSFGVKVVLIEPGPVRTEIWSKSIEHSEELEKQMSEEMHKVYGEQIKAMREGVNKTVHDAVGVEKVRDAMVEAIESNRPQLYYLLGKNIYLYSLIAKFMPPRILDRMLSTGYRMRKG